MQEKCWPLSVPLELEVQRTPEGGINAGLRTGLREPIYPVLVSSAVCDCNDPSSSGNTATMSL